MGLRADNKRERLPYRLPRPLEASGEEVFEAFSELVREAQQRLLAGTFNQAEADIFHLLRATHGYMRAYREGLTKIASGDYGGATYLAFEALDGKVDDPVEDFPLTETC